jgi:hypothetical protein
MESVYCGVRTGSLNKTVYASSSKGLIEYGVCASEVVNEHSSLWVVAMTLKIVLHL